MIYLKRGRIIINNKEPKRLNRTLAVTALEASELVLIVAMYPVKVVPILEPKRMAMLEEREIRFAAYICSKSPIIADDD